MVHKALMAHTSTQPNRSRGQLLRTLLQKNRSRVPADRHQPLGFPGPPDHQLFNKLKGSDFINFYQLMEHPAHRHRAFLSFLSLSRIFLPDAKHPPGTHLARAAFPPLFPTLCSRGETQTLGKRPQTLATAVVTGRFSCRYDTTGQDLFVSEATVTSGMRMKIS